MSLSIIHIADHAPQQPRLVKITATLDRLDLQSSIDFREAVLECITPQHFDVEIDIHAVNFMDSSGVGALMAIYQKVEPYGGRVRLIRAQPRIVALLEMLKLRALFL